MRNPRTIGAVFVAVFWITSAQAKLIVKVEEPKGPGQKTIIELSIKNSFTQKVESARATVFLIDDNDKVVGQSAQWVIGGTKDKPGLAPKASTTYNFVIKTDKPFTKTKVIFNRILLEGGNQVDPAKNVEMEK
jgi:hypothetical protein